MSVPVGAVSHCNVCGEGGKLLVCSGCKCVAYCSKEHQKKDWKAHKPACLLARQGQVVDDGGSGSEYVGTLRWGPDTKFQALPPREGALDKPAPVQLAVWEDYLDWRLRKGEDDDVVVDPSLMDAMSFPVTLAWAFKAIKLAPLITQEGKASIIIAGATKRCEERLLNETSYWSEVEPMIPCNDMQLCFVGPEVSEANHLKERRLTPRMRALCYRGLPKDFLSSGLLGKGAESGVVPLICFNGGFGSHHNKELMHSWVEDLNEIIESQMPAVFTCANDYCDVRGEMAMMTEVLGARVVLKPRPNAFKAITVVHAPGKKETTWAAANSFLYAIQGRQPGFALSTHKNDLHQRVDAVAAALGAGG